MSNSRGALWTIGVIAGIGLLVRATLLDPWRVPEEPNFNASLAPTLSSGDLVLVAKQGNAGFGALVRCTDPEDPASFVVGRVAGVGFDHVVTQGAALTVDNRRYESGLSCPKRTVEVPDPGGGDPIELSCGMVDMGGATHMRATGGRMSKEPLTERDVPQGNYFLLSDSRDMHQDSRDYGFVPAASCRRVFMRLWSKAGWGDDEHRLSYIR